MFDAPSWLLIIPILGFLIFVHELGHFATAKWFGIGVTEFGFGFPPRLAGFRFRGTLYSINALPLGGFVKMVGEEDPSDPTSFAIQARWKRAIVLVAGSFMNLVVTVVIFTVLLMVPHDELVSADVLITGVAPGSPAQAAGLRGGDTILQVDGQRVTDTRQLVDAVRGAGGRAVEVVVRRGPAVIGLGSSPELSSTDAVMLTPRSDPPRLTVVETVSDPLSEVSLRDARRYNASLQPGDTMTQGPMGVMIALANPIVRPVSEPVWRAVPMAFGTIGDILTLTGSGIASGISSGGNPGVAGPIGIAQVTGEVVDELGVWWVFQLTALLSVSLGIMNVLPIPALDGGRLLFVGIEWLRGGKRISPRREGMTHMVGFFLIIGLVVVISYFDILRVLNGGSVLR